jgi:hypothetical protein
LIVPIHQPGGWNGGPRATGDWTPPAVKGKDPGKGKF